MKIAFHFTGCVYQNDGKIWVRGQFGHLVDAIANRVEHLDLLLDKKETNDNLNFETQTDYLIKSPNVGVVSLGPPPGGLSWVQRTITMARTLPSASKNWDVIMMREPSRRTPSIRKWIQNIPKILILGGDYTFSLEHKNLSLLYIRALYFNWKLRTAMHSSLVFVNSYTLIESWKPYAEQIVLLQAATLREIQIITKPVERFSHAKPYHLLYVGRIDPLKGIDTLLKALSIVNQSEPKFDLTIVGGGRSSYVDTLQQQANELGISSAVKFMGQFSTDSILEFYRNADIYVLPTLRENVSRCVFEAMSQGCPVITTPVGGHKFAFKDKEDVLFMIPEDENDLVQKILELTRNKQLRENICKQGLQLAKTNTVEIRAKKMVDTAKLWLDKINSNI